MLVKYPKSKKVNSPEIVAEAMTQYMATAEEFDRMKEHFMVMGLSSASKPIYLEVSSMGTMTASLAHPREVFRRAVHQSCASIILIHNHPSGEINPSAEDRAITLQMTEAGKLLGIPVLDHVIVNTEPEGDLFEPKIRFYSFAKEGLIKP